MTTKKKGDNTYPPITWVLKKFSEKKGKVKQHDNGEILEGEGIGEIIFNYHRKEFGEIIK